MFGAVHAHLSRLSLPSPCKCCVHLVNGANLVLLGAELKYTLTLCKRSCSYLAPTVCNGLPLNIRLSPTFDTVHRELVRDELLGRQWCRQHEP